MKLAIITAAAAVTISACAKPPSCGSFADQQAAIEAAGQVIDRDAIPYDKFTDQQTPSETCPAPRVAPPVLFGDPTPTTPPETPVTPPSEPPVTTPETPVERVKGNNGWGNGDQAAPGNSRDRNNAENSDRTHRNHGEGRRD